jgi:hypothetical protein
MFQALPTVRASSPPERKLLINRPNDAHEVEADRISAQIMREPDADVVSRLPRLSYDFSRMSIHPHEPGRDSATADCRASVLRRKCACGGTCAECRKNNGHAESASVHESASVQRETAGRDAPGGMEAPSIVHRVLRSPGQPLDVATRGLMEARFGYDLSRVRVHTDAEAARSAEQILARAYAVGDHVVFANGRFSPGTGAGAELLAHELVHVIQAGGRNSTLRRQPDPEALLRVRIVDTLEATKSSAVDALASAIDHGDRAYLEGLELSSKQVDSLLNHNAQFDMNFGNAAELAVEKAVRNDAFLSQYVKRGPIGRVPRGVGKPDWIIETPSSRIPVDLMTVPQIEKKLTMWRRQWRRGKPKWYIEKSLNITYARPQGGAPQGTAPQGSVTQGSVTQDSLAQGGVLEGGVAAEVPRPPVPVRTLEGRGAAIAAELPSVATSLTKASAIRVAGRFIARELPGLLLEAVLMFLFPPGVNIHNDDVEKLSGEKLDPAVQDGLRKQEATINKMVGDDPSQSVYANVTVWLDYQVKASPSGDLELYLEDLRFLEMKISDEDVRSYPKLFNTTGSLKVSKQITYSFLLYEPEYVTLQKDWARAQQEYADCVQRFGTGVIPPAAGVDAPQRNPEEGPCIPPRMKRMEGS